MNQLNYCTSLNFTCDSCKKYFQKEVAYTPASNLEELDYQPTYCVDCVNISLPSIRKIKKSKFKTSFNTDGRSLNKTGRVYQLGTKVRKEFLEKLKKIAYEEGLKIVEVLEKSLECYEKERINKN